MMAMMTMMMVIECELGNNLQRGQINWLLFGPNSALYLPATLPPSAPLQKKIYDGDENKIRRMLLVFFTRPPHLAQTLGCHPDARPWQCGSSDSLPKCPK